MKKLLCALVVLGVLFQAGAQVREFIPVVKPIIHQSTQDFLLSIAEAMRQEGFSEAEEYLKAWANGGFGSGLVYVDSRNGRNYVITNRHVVTQANAVHLEFELADGTKTVYENCPIVSVSERLDLALIAFPEGQTPFRQSLPFARSLPADGSDIWSAGYPGLLSRPSWQFAKGSVSNQSVRVPELADPADALLIQHSAPIDSGSSGGPLVAQAGAGRYEVVGINTWKVLYRQGTNFAIPVTAIQAFLDGLLAAPSIDPVALLEQRAADFLEVAASGDTSYRDLARFISDEYVAEAGRNAFNQALMRAPSKIRNDIITTFSEVSPMEGVKLALAWLVNEALLIEESLTFSGIEASEAASAQLAFSYDEGSMVCDWILEQGHWRLASLPLLDSQAARASAAAKASSGGASIASPYDAMLGIGLAHVAGSLDCWMVAFNLTVTLGYSDYFFLTVDSGVGNHKYQTYSGPDSSLLLHARPGLMAQLPVRLGDLYLIPYAKVGAGLFMPLGFDMSLDPVGYTGIGGGMNLMFPNQNWVLSAEYMLQGGRSLDSIMFGESAPKQSLPMFHIFVSISA